ncbi:ribosome biogenesis GTPase [Porphyromonas circumdentaria]|uniref:Small ribosomal subunit biogenesis GTPase RsgA n=2 Tax=Porphyromonas circumdentaria TaxID=29524 RepID=A0A1T4M795_9PORP|nr:ribosome biogenesis GTPase [Porphyromonas circumdentaria]SJZ62727.1 ribosome biogenesis GTPase [Porphyromonas circumdentaria]
MTLMQGLVLRCVGNNCLVRLNDGSLCEATVKGNLRLKGIRSTNPVAVGDSVSIKKQDTIYYITSILPRRNYIIRRAANLSKESHILAANIDVVLLFVTLQSPETSFTFVDRFLSTAEAYDVPVVLLFNKMDLYDEAQLFRLKEWEDIYAPLGYPILKISALEKRGLDELYDYIRGKIVLLSGHSGVGKSSLINALLPNMNLRTQEVSVAHGTGMHTTTLSEMHPLDEAKGGGYLIDSPGIKGFGTLEMNKYNTADYFREFFIIGQGCRFNNCTHTNEPGCAVLQALKEGRIAESRYISYLGILGDEDEGKYRLD